MNRNWLECICGHTDVDLGPKQDPLTKQEHNRKCFHDDLYKQQLLSCKSELYALSVKKIIYINLLWKKKKRSQEHKNINNIFMSHTKNQQFFY